MRVMVLAKSSPEAESMPDVQDASGMEAMMAFHKELSDAGVLLASDRLAPSSMSARVKFDGETRTVIDGPFTESKEIVGGFWIWQVRSFDEGVEWLKRAPFGGGMELEIRPILDMPDFAG